MDHREEFVEFCRSAHPRLVAALAHHTGDRWLAEELAHEALIRAADRWTSVRSLDAPLGWCFRVGANLASSHFRRGRIEARARERMRSAGAVAPPVAAADAEVADRLAVRTALQHLPARSREVVVLRYFLDLTAEDAGRLVGMSAGAVRVTCHRALQAIRDVVDVEDEPVVIEEATDVS